MRGRVQADASGKQIHHWFAFVADGEGPLARGIGNFFERAAEALADGSRLAAALYVVHCGAMDIMTREGKKGAHQE